MRVFMSKSVRRWSRKERIAETVLWQAAVDVVAGRVDADLGGCLFKMRIARAGEGKRGGHRTIIGYRRGQSDRIVILFGFAKNVQATIS